MFVYHKIKDVDFQYLCLFIGDKILPEIAQHAEKAVEKGVEKAGEAFKRFFMMQVHAVGMAVDYLDMTEKGAMNELASVWQNKFVQLWNQREHQETQATNIANNILEMAKKPNTRNPIRYMTPEARGIILYYLCTPEFSLWPKARVKAIVEILSFIQTHSDFNHVLERMNPDGKKGNKQEGWNKLFAMFETPYAQWKIVEHTSPLFILKSIYDQLTGNDIAALYPDARQRNTAVKRTLEWLVGDF